MLDFSRFLAGVAVLLPLTILVGGADVAATEGTTADWPNHGGTLENIRFSELTQINRKNVNDLEVKWVFQTGLGSDPQVGFYMSPIVIDGTMYVSDPGAFVEPKQNVFALDAGTGHQLWHTELALGDFLGGSLIWRPHKGVAYGNGKVFMATFDGRLWALDAVTGEPIDEFSDGPGPQGFVQVGDPDAGYYLTAAPIFVASNLVPAGGPASGHDLVLIGISGGDNGTRGYISAYDADNGDLLWRFFTVPGPGEFGGDTWPTNEGTLFEDPFTRGGAAVWMNPAFDPETGLVIFATGNAGVDLDGTHRAGDNLFAASVVAVDAATGERAWHFQEVHHDIWDYDQASSPLLFEMKVKGKARRNLKVKGEEVKAVGAAGKTGWYYILDRLTGEPIHPCPETPVPTFTDVVAPDGSLEQPSPTQPVCESDAFVPQGDRILPSGRYAAPIFTPPGLPIAGNQEPFLLPAFPLVETSGVLVEPGIMGGSEWSPPAHSAALGLSYIAGNIVPSTYTAIPEAEPASPNQGLVPNIGGYWTHGSTEDVLTEFSGNLTAIDPSTGKIRWQQPTDTPMFNGVCATAGDLVFVGEVVNGDDPTDPAAFFTAFDARNGRRLWQWRVPGDITINAPCISYEVDGRQFIAVAIGGYFRYGQAFGGNGDFIYAFGLPDG